MSKTRVCVLTTVLDSFKGGNHLPLFAACAQTEFTIVCNRSKVPTGQIPKNVKVITVPARTGPYYGGCADFLFARAVLARFSPNDAFWKGFDVLHFNQVMGPHFRKLKKTDVPLLLLIHHPVTADREIAVAESGFSGACAWRVKYALLVRWQRAMCAVADRIVTVSHTMRSRIASDYAVTAEKIAVVENGVDGAAFVPVPDAQCTTDVIAVGSFIHPRKGFRYLARVYRALAAAGCSIADVGRRSDAQAAVLRRIPGVTLHGTVDEVELRHLLSHARVLISTSLFEGFGLSLIEALCCGRPAFAFSVGAMPEVLGDIDRGLLVPPRDTDAMVNVVTRYLALSPEERDQRGAEYRRHVVGRYPLSASAHALESVYATMAS